MQGGCPRHLCTPAVVQQHHNNSSSGIGTQTKKKPPSLVLSLVYHILIMLPYHTHTHTGASNTPPVSYQVCTYAYYVQYAYEHHTTECLTESIQPRHAAGAVSTLPSSSFLSRENSCCYTITYHQIYSAHERRGHKYTTASMNTNSSHLGVISNVAVHDRKMHKVRVLRGADGGHPSRIRRLDVSQLPKKLQSVLKIRPQSLARPPHVLRHPLRPILLLEAHESSHPLEENRAQQVRVVAVVHGGRVGTHQEPPREHPVRLHRGPQVDLPLLVDGRQLFEGRERAGFSERLWLIAGAASCSVARRGGVGGVGVTWVGVTAGLLIVINSLVRDIMSGQAYVQLQYTSIYY